MMSFIKRSFTEGKIKCRLFVNYFLNCRTLTLRCSNNAFCLVLLNNRKTTEKMQLNNKTLKSILSLKYNFVNS